ncbi:MAG: short-chain dehydrogenase [Acetobacteraceae bacterium SCN 69-10]|nr:SDR family oxidoreductase [Rhodospirillales bacterium]ODU53919.1 MAG: short-chain dehydrogenase [Acetobacteraceae bacterium SCN 69-10]OJY65709.1 MAG: short-chain dehydrogenase [Rhodospirillales bacterium 70-18]
MDIRLTGRAAIVTGGSKGLGLAMAKRFAASGADVAILARTQSTLDAARAEILAAAPGRRVAAIACDVSRADEIARAHAAAMAELGRIDIVVNNAGTSRTGAFESITDEIWQEDLDLKLFAAIRLTRLVWPQLRERRWGRVINVLNIGAKAPRAGGCPTVVSRAAGMALTKVLAGEGAPHGILVNALLVGLIATDQVARAHAGLVAKGQNLTLEEHMAKVGAPVPLGRMGRAEEFANMACFLASDAGGYITGTAINVDGGMSPVV